MALKPLAKHRYFLLHMFVKTALADRSLFRMVPTNTAVLDLPCPTSPGSYRRQDPKAAQDLDDHAPKMFVSQSQLPLGSSGIGHLASGMRSCANRCRARCGVALLSPLQLHSLDKCFQAGRWHRQDILKGAQSVTKVADSNIVRTSGTNPIRYRPNYLRTAKPGLVLCGPKRLDYRYARQTSSWISSNLGVDWARSFRFLLAVHCPQSSSQQPKLTSVQLSQASGLRMP